MTSGRRSKARAGRRCPVCGTWFVPRPGQTYCTVKCRKKAENDRARERMADGDERRRLEEALLKANDDAGAAHAAAAMARDQLAEARLRAEKAEAERDTIARAWMGLVDMGVLSWNRTRAADPSTGVHRQGLILAQSIAATPPTPDDPVEKAFAQLEADRQAGQDAYRRLRAQYAAQGKGEPPLGALHELTMGVDERWLRDHPDLRDEYHRRALIAARGDDEDPEF